LVRECLQERELLLRLAPELVRMKPFCIPVYKTGSRSATKIALGLSLYALLNGLRASSRFKTLARRDWDALDGLSTNQLHTVFQYYDAQTDDQALTKAVMRSAMQLGAELRMPAQFTTAKIGRQCEVNYARAGSELTCTASLLINAAGPWVPEILASITPQQAPLPMDMMQGTHIVLRFPLGERIYYLEAPQDKRAVFVMPWKNHTLVGTTETLFRHSPDQVKPLDSEVRYLLETYAHYFAFASDPSIDLKKSIIEQFAGLRVLPAGGTTAFRRARDTMIQWDNAAAPKVASVYGGKLTAYRATAEKVMQGLLPYLPNRKRLADTRELSLTPAD
jgi:glycerol-3-phosphate dehydrogenase